MNRNVFSLLLDNRIGLDVSDIELEKKLIDTVLNSLRIKRTPTSNDVEIIPYTTKQTLYNPQFLEIVTNNFLKKKNLLIGSKGRITIKDKDATILIRVNHSSSEPQRNTSILGICNLIRTLIRNGNNQEKYQFILIFNTLPSSGLNLLSELIDDYCKTDKIVFLDKEGQSFEGGTNLIKEFNDYYDKTEYLTIKKSIGTKLIKRVGHFLRSAEDDSLNYKCHKFFYEGQECIEDIEFFLKILIRKNQYQNILFYCPESKWLKMAVSGAVDTQLKQLNLNKIDIEINIDEIELLKNGTKTLLIFDLIDSGNTYKAINQKILESNSKIKYDTVSILVTNNSRNSSIKRELLTYLEDVIQHPYEGQNENCPYCKLGIPHDEKDLDIKNEKPFISTFNFWMLADDAGFGKEKHYPKQKREPLKYVPYFDKMLQDNGAFLAYKTKALLTRKKIDTLSDYIFLSPDEDGATSYAKSLQSMYNIHTIHIPRKEIDEIALIVKKKGPKDRLKKRFFQSKWYIELTSNIIKKVIVFDEFCVSMTTFQTLHDLLEIVKKELVCFMPMVNFSSNSLLEEKKIISLYSFELMLSKPKLKIKKKNYGKRR